MPRGIAKNPKEKRDKISTTMKRYCQTEEGKANTLKRIAAVKQPEVNVRKSESRKRYCREHPEEVSAVNSAIAARPEVRHAKGKACTKQTTLEREFNTFLQQLVPGLFEYNGATYSFRVGKRWPDFVCFERHLIIDLFSTRWHSPEFSGMSREEHERERVSYFEERGWRTLVVWEKDFKEHPELVKERVLEFIHTP